MMPFTENTSVFLELWKLETQKIPITYRCLLTALSDGNAETVKLAQQSYEYYLLAGTRKQACFHLIGPSIIKHRPSAYQK
jgi:hypothetical protein